MAIKNLTARLPDDLWLWYRERAKAQNRSANQQLVADLSKMKEQENAKRK
ncbi:hypothetical protein OSS47_28165 [Pseudomonas citronellolis]|nr:hypothetical protein [Pseudomonas citronellolis]WAB91944.1 hypothetical protein OSS47_28165 [Pseudomonas citronellolis]